MINEFAFTFIGMQKCDVKISFRSDGIFVWFTSTIYMFSHSFKSSYIVYGDNWPFVVS